MVRRTGEQLLNYPDVFLLHSRLIRQKSGVFVKKPEKSVSPQKLELQKFDYQINL